MPGSADGGENAGWPKVANRLTTRYKESMSMLTPGLASGAQRLRRLESVVSALLEHGTMSRTELAETTGYSQSSMTASIRHLIQHGHVIETGRGRSTGGRRRTLLEFDRRSVLLMLLSIDSGHVVARQVDLAGTVHVQVRRSLDPEQPLTSIVEIGRASCRERGEGAGVGGGGEEATNKET